MFSPLVSMSHLTLNFFLNFALSFAVDKLAQIKRNEIRFFFLQKLFKTFFYIKNDIEERNRKSKRKERRKKGGNERL